MPPPAPDARVIATGQPIAVDPMGDHPLTAPTGASPGLPGQGRPRPHARVFSPQLRQEQRMTTERLALSNHRTDQTTTR